MSAIEEIWTVAVSFRNRLAIFLSLTLVVVQGLTALLVYDATRRALIAQSERSLAASTELFLRQMQSLSARVSDSVQILSLDFALRQAVTEQNHQTVLSALRNHGRRVGAASMMWIGIDGSILADTGQEDAVGQPFPLPELLDQAVVDGRASVITSSGGKAFWLVVVPVKAPIPIGYVGANIPLDDAMLDRLRQLSALPPQMLLVSRAQGGAWTVLAKSQQSALALDQLLPAHAPPPLDRPLVQKSGEREDIVLASHLPTRDSESIVVVVGLSLDEALQPYRSVILWASLLLLGGLVAALVVTTLVARGVSRPLEALAEVARRIAGGDYRPPQSTSQTRELAELSGALGNMAAAIGEREEHIRYQAGHDAITGLPNRLALTERIDRDLADDPTAPASLIMVGVLRLQEIVNTLGHDFRDRLMRFLGDRLNAVAGDGGQVARVSDIAFALWLPGDRDASQTAQRLAAVAEDFKDGDVTVDIATALGIARVPEHGTEAALLLQHADTALHDALARTDDRLVIYDPASDPHRSERLSLMRDLRQALDQGALTLFYQPKIELASGLVAGAEGLVRWTHPVRGPVPPDSFIHLAEETGNIRRLTQWALDTGMAMAADWRQRGLRLRISVNVSARDLGDSALPDRVADGLVHHRISPADLVLEITESAIMGEPDAAIRVLRRLADLGIDLSIDDFGVGQSSFAYLRRLPVREIKIDQSFVLKLASSAEDATIVRSIVELGHSLGYRVTAEGVEDEASFRFLAEIGCDYAQGYFIAKPLATEDFDRLLRGDRWKPRQLAVAE